MHVNGLVGNWLAIFGVISLIYFGWRITIAFQKRRSARAPDEPATTSLPAPTAAASTATPAATLADDIVVIAAAAYAMIGEHRIVHIEAASQNQAWAAEGRWLQQTSHRPR